MSCAPVDLTGPPVMTLPKRVGDIREPHRLPSAGFGGYAEAGGLIE